MVVWGKRMKRGVSWYVRKPGLGVSQKGEWHTPTPVHVCSNPSSCDSLPVPSTHTPGLALPRPETSRQPQQGLQAGKGTFCCLKKQPLPSNIQPWLQTDRTLPPVLFSLFSSPQVCHCFFLSLTFTFPLLLKAMNRAQKLHEGQMYSSRKSGSAADGTKYREDTNSFSWRTPVLSFSNHAAILLPEWGHFMHVLMQGIVQSWTQAPQVHQT